MPVRLVQRVHTLQVVPAGAEMLPSAPHILGLVLWRFVQRTSRVSLCVQRLTINCSSCQRLVFVSASLHNTLSERWIFVGNKMKIKLVGNISRI